MEPSSTSFRRAGALLTMTAVVWLSSLDQSAARGFAQMGRVQAIRAVPGIPAQIHPAHRAISGHPIVAPRNAFLQHRLSHRHFARGAASGPWGSYGYASPYVLDAGQPEFAAPGAIEPVLVPFEQAACVRPLIIEIKPTQHAERLPRVIYGRPPLC